MKSKFKKMLYGGDYNPEQWPREIWKKDMELFDMAGINSATVNVFSWAKIQPSEEIYDFSELDDIVDKVDIIEDNIDATTQEFTVNQLSRLKKKICSAENSVVYTKTLTDFERIGDHGLNIAKNFSKLEATMVAMKMVEA